MATSRMGRPNIENLHCADKLSRESCAEYRLCYAGRQVFSHRTFLSFCCKRVQVMEGERFIISDKWEGTESVVEGFSPKNPDLPWRRPRCNIAKFVLV